MGTIAEKLTYLDETREKIRKGINSIGGNLTNTDTFRSYSDALDGIYEKFPKVTGTGSNITLEDTMGASIKSELQGDTTQEGTPTPSSPVAVETVTGEQSITTWGKNLFNDTLEVGTINSSGNNATSTDNMRNADYISVNQQTTYTISASSNCYIGIRYYNSSKTFLSSGTTAEQPNTFTTPENCKYVRFVFVNITDTTVKVQLEKGSTASEYEVYKEQSYEINLGNIELCKIGDYKDFIKKGTGKNLFDKDNANIINASVINNVITESNSAKMFYISCEPNTTYTISREIVGARFVGYTTNTTPTTGVSTLQIVSGNTASSITITTDANANYLLVYYLYNSSENETQILSSIQVELGSTATPYEPYGMYNKWYIEKQIGKVVLDGTQDLYKAATGTENYYRYNIDIGTNIFTTDETTAIAPIYCNRLVGVTRGNTFSRIEGIAPTTNNYNYKSFNFYIEALAQMANAQVNNWLASNNMIVYYIYKTPTYTEITDTELKTQLEEFDDAQSYEGQTNINVDGILPTILNVKALENIFN